MAVVRFAGFDSEEPDIVLRRIGREKYRLVVPFRYQDAEFGTITVPLDVDHFDTDFASVPWFTAWFVPVFGEHVPAVLLHDALVGTDGNPTYRTRDGHVIGRDDADRVFNDAMRVLGTPTVRRLVIWSASAVASAGARSAVRFYVWVLFVLVLAVSHLVDIMDVSPMVPWLGDWSFLLEWAASAALIAVVLAIAGPFVLGFRYAKATAVQAVIVGLVFLPVLTMLIPWLLLSKLPEMTGRE